MAKKKTQTEEIENPVNEVETPIEGQEAVVPTVEETPAEETTETVEPTAPVETPEAPEKPIQEEKPKTATKAKKDIPEYALEILKTFKNHKELMITPQGGVFSADSKLGAAKGAILYKNPYFKP